MYIIHIEKICNLFIEKIIWMIKIKRELYAEVLETLIKHLQKRNDVQNIDLMNLSGFCRNCLSKWYVNAAGKNKY